MFNYTIDSKSTVVDNNGNTLVDLTKSIFARKVGKVMNYTVKKAGTHAAMRPDIVSMGEYGTPEYTEFILKYTGISNPFTLDEDDILLIPDEDDAYAKMDANTVDDVGDGPDNAKLVRNYYKFVNQDYKKDSTSYDELKKKQINSAVQTIDGTLSGDFVVPYISTDTKSSVTIRNGRIFFGEDSGLMTNEVIKASTTNLDEKIQALIDSAGQAMADKNCLYNGTTMADFVRAQTKAATDVETYNKTQQSAMSSNMNSFIQNQMGTNV